MKLGSYLNLLQEHGLLLASQAVDVNAELVGMPRTDNRLLEAGDIFVCIKGFTDDGHRYIPDARQKEAALVVCENEFSDTLPALRVSDSRKAAALLAKLYYADPSSRFRLIGITGTNGKTTTSLLLFKAIRELGIAAGWIGTLGYYINEEQFSTRHTTPDIMELNAIFAQMAQREVKYVIMEVSSHALALDRVYGAEFDFCLFTNLSREHLDFHHTMDDYGAAKLKLFDCTKRQKAVAVINTDDGFGRQLFDQIRQQDGYAFSVGTGAADYMIRAKEFAEHDSWQQSRFSVLSSEGIINIRSSLIGRFNISNLALAAATLSILGFEARQIEQGLNIVPPIPGRFESVPNRHGIGVFVDYAHTPDAIENVLKACRELKHRRILCLIGAGGDRDQGKRPLMLQAALHNADAVIISDDNPRTENPNRIIRDIIKDTLPWLPWWIIRDRKQAIAAILRLAQPGDIVVISGKGHETYQEIEGERHEFDDHAIAQAWLDTWDPEAVQDQAKLVLPVDRLLLEVLANVPVTEQQGYQPPSSYAYFSTDSRTIVSGSVFFALKGNRFDGHAFIPNVLRDRANLAVGELELNPDPNYLLVNDVNSLMGSLFRKYLLMFPVYKIALTGSTGKTSTKEMIAQIFSAHQPTLKSLSNENNLIGLCQTLQRIQPEHQYAIFELGTNNFGEIALLSDICAPDAALILNIGPSHLEFLGDENGVFREKKALFDRPLDIRLFDAADPRFEEYRSCGKSVGTIPEADFRITDTEAVEGGNRFRLNEESYVIPYQPSFYVQNAGFAIALGLLKGIPSATIRKALAQVVQLPLRMQIEPVDKGILINDCYNANPISMQKALEYWHQFHAERPHIAILGDMLELGAQAGEYHDMIAAMLAELGYDQLITVGSLSSRYHGSDPRAGSVHFAEVESLLQSNVLSALPDNCVILLKASHGIHLELLIPHLKAGD